jgi:diguanylate cyclase (GGDEF)-like protein
MEEIKGGSNSSQLAEFSVAGYSQAFRELYLAKNSDDLLERLLKKIDELFGPECTVFLLRDQASRDLKYAKIIGPNSQSFQDKFVRRGEGLCGLAAETNQDIIITDSSRDPRFNSAADQWPGLEIRTMIALPFRLEKKIFGVVELLNKKNNTIYTLDELKLLTNLVAFAELVLGRIVLLKHISTREEFDPLSEAYNLRSFVNYFQREIARAERYGIDLSLLKTKIDYYEKIIQTFGQEAGERVVINLSFILRKTTRKVDLVARISENEFMLMLPNTNRDGANKLRMRILNILENQNLRTTGIPYTVTIDVFSENGQAVSTLLKVPEIRVCLNQVSPKNHQKKYPTPGEELEEIIISSLFPGQKRML